MPSATTSIDGVERMSPTGVSLLIIGAGIGGLFAALEAYRQGHTIIGILEKAPTMETVGDCFGLLPPALSSLRYFPTMKAQFERESYDAQMSLWRYEGRPLTPGIEGQWNAPGAVHSAKGVYVPWIESRKSVVMMLYEQCVRLNIPVMFSQQVKEYNEDANVGWVVTTDGKRHSADLVVAADGVGTKSHLHVTGQVLRSVSSDYAVYRVMIPMDHLLANVSQACKDRYLNDARPQFRIVLAHDMHSNLITTKDWACYILTHRDEAESAESWGASVSKEAPLATLDEVPGWDPLFLEIIQATLPHSVVDWKLLWRDPQPDWASKGGRVLQLGDAAHSFLPTSGNGATQAMEDGLSLATCLRLGGPQNLRLSTKAHTKLRFERVSTLQKFGLLMRDAFHNVDLDAAEKDPSILGAVMPEWIWTHDPAAYAEEKFHGALAHVRDGAPFESTNSMPGVPYEAWTVESLLGKEKEANMTALA